jgi:hypothetical protein
MPPTNPRNLSPRRRISGFSVKCILILLVSLAAANAQIGYPGQTPYPGQSPYPGRRTPQTGPSVPLPGKGKSDSKNSKTAQPMPNFRGTLQLLDEKTIRLELGDNRVLDFKRTDKTKFLKNGDEVKQPKFDNGDQISVEAMEDPNGYLTAVNVYWEKAAGAATPSKSNSTYDTWKDDPAEKPRERATETAPPAGRPDPEDPGPPKLKRGGVEDSSRQRAKQDYPDTPAAPPAAPPTATAAPPEREEERPRVARRDADEDSNPSSIQRRPDDPLLRRAADAALEFTEGLPAYVCTEAITRYASETKPADFRPLDVVTTEVVYENGREDYRNVMINGKKSAKSLEETGGAWSTGEFGTVLLDLFSPSTAAQFHYRRDSRVGNVSTKVYDYTVDRENSHWNIMAGSQSYRPAYTGSLYIDPSTGRVMRIEREAKSLPEEFPLDHVEATSDYANVRLGDTKEYILPVHAETLSCQRGTLFCARNAIDFRNYRKFAGQSNITFGGETKTDKK